MMEGRGSDTRGKFGLRAGKLWKLPLCGSSGKIKLQRQFPHCFHIAWKTLRKKQKRGDFPTVPTASAAGFNLEPETGEPSRNLLREAARNLPWEALGASGTWLAARKLNRSRLGDSFFLTAPFHRTCDPIIILKASSIIAGSQVGKGGLPPLFVWR